MRIALLLILSFPLWAQYQPVPSTRYPGLETILNAKPAAQTGSGAPSGNCTRGKDFYIDTTAKVLYYCSATNGWTKALSPDSSGNVAISASCSGGATNSVCIGGTFSSGGVTLPTTFAGWLNWTTGTPSASTVLGGDGAWKTVSSGFDALTSGTNSSATMTVGTGGTVTYSGSGVVNANQLNGATPRIGTIVGNPNSNWATGVTQYLSITSGGTTESQKQMLVPGGAGHMRDLYINIQNTQSGGSMVCTARLAAGNSGGSPSGTSLVVTIPSSSTTNSYSDTSDIVAVTPGQLLSIGCLNNGNGQSATVIAWSVSFTL